MFLKTLPEISRRIFWDNKNFWKWKFQHTIKPEIDRRWPYVIVQLTIWILEHWEFTHVIVWVPLRFISLLFWSCQFTDRKKFEHLVKKAQLLKTVKNYSALNEVGQIVLLTWYWWKSQISKTSMDLEK